MEPSEGMEGISGTQLFGTSSEGIMGSGEIVEWERVLCEHEYLSSDPRNPYENPGVTVCTDDPALRHQTKRNGGG